MKFQDLASLLASKQQEDEMMSVGGNADINQIAPPPEMPRQKSPDEMLLERLSTPDIQQRQEAALAKIQSEEIMPSISSIQEQTSIPPKQNLEDLYKMYMDTTKQNEEKMDEAQKLYNREVALNDLNQSGARLGQAFSIRGGVGGITKAPIFDDTERDNAIAKQRYDMTKSNMENKTANRIGAIKTKDMVSDLKDKESGRDPQSPKSKYYRDLASSRGLPVTEDLSADDIEKLLPNEKDKIKDAYLLKQMEIADFSMGARLQDMDLRKQKESRLGSQFDFTKEQKDELSDKQVETLTGFDNVLNTLAKIPDLKSKVNTGPYAAKMQNAKNYIPGMEADPDFTALQQLSGLNLFDYVRNQSGASYTAQELEALRKNSPDIYDDDKTFKVKFKNFMKVVEDKKNQFVSNAAKTQGKNVPETRNQQKSPANSIDPRVESFMKKNNIKDVNEAIKILKENGKI